MNVDGQREEVPERRAVSPGPGARLSADEETDIGIDQGGRTMATVTGTSGNDRLSGTSSKDFI